MKGSERAPQSGGPGEQRMRVYEIQDSFGLDHLVQVERPEPEPGHGKVEPRRSKHGRPIHVEFGVEPELNRRAVRGGAVVGRCWVHAAV